MIGEFVQRVADGELIATQIYAHAGNCFVEQTAPCSAAGHFAFVDETLQLIGQLMRAIDAQIA